MMFEHRAGPKQSDLKGDPMPKIHNRPLAPLSLSDKVRLLSKITILREFECWPWTAGKTPDGYGMIGLRLMVDDAPQKGADGWHWQLAPRAVYFLFYGVDPGSGCVLHTCDNPQCCNPYHLFLGTKSQNNLDRAMKLRTAGTKLQPEAISQIFGWSKAGHSSTEIVSMLVPFGYSVTSKTVRDALSGKTWAWLVKPKPKCGLCGDRRCLPHCPQCGVEYLDPKWD